MGRRLAKRVEDRIQLDTPIRLRVYTARSAVTGKFGGTPTADVRTWAAIDTARSMLDITAERSTLYFPAAYIVRYNALWATLHDRRVTVQRDGETARVTTVQRIGRRRFLRLEVKA